MHLGGVDEALDECGLLPEPAVLIIDDDRDLAQMERRFIERAGMRTAWAGCGEDALRLMESFRPDVVLVDLGLPDIDGGKLVEFLASKGACGIIVVSGRGEDIERIVEIERGADDYIVKPPMMREMVARIRAVHRRVAAAAPILADPHPAPPEFVLGEARVDLRRRVVTDRHDRPIRITAAEFDALEALLRAAPHPVSRERLCRTALRRPLQAEDRGVDQLVFNLRRKLFGDGSGHGVIVSVRGAGYAAVIERNPQEAARTAA